MSQPLRAFASLIAALLCCSTSVAIELAATPAVDRCSDATIELHGPVQDYVEAVTNNWLCRAPRDNPAILEMFAVRDQQPYRDYLPWSGEFAGKYLTGATQVLRVNDDPRLKQVAAKFVAQLTPLQAENGYLGPFPAESQLTGTAPNCGNGGPTWDLWGHYHAMLGLMLWYDETGDPKALEAARRIGDLLCEKFLNTDRAVSSTGSSEMNQAVVHSLALLYKKTGDEKYLELAEACVADFAADKCGDYLRQGLQNVEFFQTPKPRWESLHPIMGLAELYWITGNNDYRTAFENLWWSIVKTDRHNNGGFSSGEQAQGNPYHQGAIETCCTIAWMAMSVEMLRLTGDPLVADELELSTLNQAIGNYSPTGQWSTYNTPMEGRRIPSTQDIAFQIRPGSEELNCCSVNAARGFGMISDWALMRDNAGLILNWYGPSVLEAAVDGTPVKLAQQTDYPRGGRIELSVDPAKPVKFDLKLRIPHWSANSKIAVNGREVEAKSGTYLSLDREWKAGDKVTIDLDMTPRYWAGERESDGKASCYRGPLLMVLDGPNAQPAEFAGAWNAYGPSRSTLEKGAKATFVFEGDAVEWRGGLFDDAGKARVSIDGKAVETVDQYGPQRGAPFVWKRSGLGAGKHTLVVETLGEKSPESSNTWVNVGEFVVPFTQPAFRTADIAKGVVADDGSTTGAAKAMAAIEVTDAAGKTIRLRDFATAGHDAPYFSWLKIDGATAVPFSRENPSRTSAAK